MSNDVRGIYLARERLVKGSPRESWRQDLPRASSDGPTLAPRSPYTPARECKPIPQTRATRRVEMAHPAPRMTRMHSLRRLQQRLDRTVESAGPSVSSSTRRGEIASVSLELQRELARLEQMPWPSGRVLVTSGDGRPLERRLLPLLRELRDHAASRDESRLSPSPTDRTRARTLTPGRARASADPGQRSRSWATSRS
jgi:hypothetical protein